MPRLDKQQTLLERIQSIMLTNSSSSPLTSSQLAIRLRVTRESVSNVLRKLCSQGVLIRRKVDGIQGASGQGWEYRRKE